MIDETKNDLFEIRINETGISYIRKLSRLSGVIYIILLAVSILFFFIGIAGIIQNNKYEIPGVWESLRAKSPPVFLILTMLGNLIGVYYYVKFLRTMNNSIDNNNETSFNRSFRYILRNAVIFLITIIINLISAVVSLSLFL